MSDALDTLRNAGAFSALDVEFARALCRLARVDDDLLLFGASLASRQTQAGHVCAHLARFAGQPIRTPDGEAIGAARFPDLDVWKRSLAASALTGTAGRSGPLVLDERGRLYLRRFYEHEQRLARLLLDRSHRETRVSDVEPLRHALGRLFGERRDEPFDAQRFAAQVAALGRLLVLCGGPGTGKTSTVVRVAALLLDRLVGQGRRHPRLLLLAPTGKAAARLGESVKRAKDSIDVDPLVRDLIVEEALTVHRALGPVGRSGTRFRCNAERPLAADIVVVDEASMVDVALMRHLLDAVPNEAHLVIVGDPDQLSSVEAGAVLADMTHDARSTYSRAFARRFEEAYGESLPESLRSDRTAGISDSVVRLDRSYRFAASSSIGRLTAAIRGGDPDEALHCLQVSGEGYVRLIESEDRLKTGPALAERVVRGFEPMLRAGDAATALSGLERFRVLCAHRRGPDGVEQVNPFIERALERAGLLRLGGPYYSGRPLLITENDYEIGLFNGDVGIVWREAKQSAPRAYFLTSGRTLRTVATSRLPAHETAFAMSIHKSQGSEFDDVVVLLPDETSPLASRELVYTAVSRARRTVTLLAARTDVRAAIGRRVERDSGLRDLLTSSDFTGRLTPDTTAENFEF